jgi:hypothetical protein
VDGPQAIEGYYGTAGKQPSVCPDGNYCEQGTEASMACPGAATKMAKAAFKTCAYEHAANDYCQCTGKVRYGADSRWIENEVSGGINCNIDAMGSDPAIGIGKTCQCFACSLQPGYYAAGQTCANVGQCKYHLCPAGYYCTGDGRAQRCPAGSTSRLKGVTDQSGCNIMRGYYGRCVLVWTLLHVYVPILVCDHLQLLVLAFLKQNV